MFKIERAENSWKFMTTTFYKVLLKFFKLLSLYNYCDNAAECPYIPHPSFPIINILHQYGTVLRVNEQLFMRYFKFHPLFILLGFPMSFFFPEMLSRTPHSVWKSHLLGPWWLPRFSWFWQPSLSWWVPVFCRAPPLGICLMFF